MHSEYNTQTRPAKVRLCGLWKDNIKNKTILTGGLCGGIKLVLIPNKNRDPESKYPDALLYSVPKQMLETARQSGIDEEAFKGHRVTGLWLKESRTGKYYAGNWEPDTSLFVFRNNNQQPGKNQPDYEVFLVPKVRKATETDQSDDQSTFEESTEEELQDDWIDFDSSRAEHPVDDEYAGMSFD
jgi:hypothetical protein